jgi:glutathione S-transferase
MAAPIVFGPGYSTYARTVRLVLAEKGVDYRFEFVNMLAGEASSGAHAARHPFGKVPTLEHDGFSLYETGAIVRYLDRVFPTPSLQPQDPRQCARMDQIISIIDSYAYGSLIGQLAWQRLVVPMIGGTPDEGVVQASLPRVKLCLSEFERLAEGGRFLVGSSVSLADCYLAPVLWYLAATPEGKPLLAASPKLSAWRESFAERESMKNTEPQFG